MSWQRRRTVDLPVNLGAFPWRHRPCVPSAPAEAGERVPAATPAVVEAAGRSY